MESSPKQASFGKQILGIMVTDDQGRRISFARAFMRHLAELLNVLTLFIGYIIIAFTPKKQGLHDMVTNCLVVKGKPVVAPAA